MENNIINNQMSLQQIQDILNDHTNIITIHTSNEELFKTMRANDLMVCVNSGYIYLADLDLDNKYPIDEYRISWGFTTINAIESERRDSYKPSNEHFVLDKEARQWRMVSGGHDCVSCDDIDMVWKANIKKVVFGSWEFTRDDINTMKLMHDRFDISVEDEELEEPSTHSDGCNCTHDCNCDDIPF